MATNLLNPECYVYMSSICPLVTLPASLVHVKGTTGDICVPQTFTFFVDSLYSLLNTDVTCIYSMTLRLLADHESRDTDLALVSI